MPANRPPMAYSEMEAASELKPWVAAYWHFEVEAGAAAIEHWVPPSGGVMLALPHAGEPALVGPRVTPFRTAVRGGDLLWGVHFWPGAARSLLGLGATALREWQGSARSAIDSGLLEPLVEAVAHEHHPAAAAVALDRVLATRLGATPPLDGIAMTAVFRIIASGGGLRIDELARELGLSTRQLRRRFRSATELSPKELARLQRLRSSAMAVVASQPQRWVDIAAAHGYADQAHLVREFRRVVGLTPAALERHLRRIEHGPLVR